MRGPWPTLIHASVPGNNRTGYQIRAPPQAIQANTVGITLWAVTKHIHFAKSAGNEQVPLDSRSKSSQVSTNLKGCHPNHFSPLIGYWLPTPLRKHFKCPTNVVWVFPSHTHKPILIYFLIASFHYKLNLWRTLKLILLTSS